MNAEHSLKVFIASGRHNEELLFPHPIASHVGECAPPWSMLRQTLGTAWAPTHNRLDGAHPSPKSPASRGPMPPAGRTARALVLSQGCHNAFPGAEIFLLLELKFIEHVVHVIVVWLEDVSETSLSRLLITFDDSNSLHLDSPSSTA